MTKFILTAIFLIASGQIFGDSLIYKNEGDVVNVRLDAVCNDEYCLPIKNLAQNVTNELNRKSGKEKSSGELVAEGALIVLSFFAEKSFDGEYKMYISQAKPGMGWENFSNALGFLGSSVKDMVIQEVKKQLKHVTEAGVYIKHQGTYYAFGYNSMTGEFSITKLKKADDELEKDEKVN